MTFETMNSIILPVTIKHIQTINYIYLLRNYTQVVCSSPVVMQCVRVYSFWLACFRRVLPTTRTFFVFIAACRLVACTSLGTHSILQWSAIKMCKRARAMGKPQKQRARDCNLIGQNQNAISPQIKFPFCDYWCTHRQPYISTGHMHKCKQTCNKCVCGC